MSERVVEVDSAEVTFVKPHPALTHVISSYAIFKNEDRLAIDFTDSVRLAACRFLVAYIHQEIADHLQRRFPILFRLSDNCDNFDPSLVVNHFSEVEYKDGRVCVDARLACRDDQFRTLLFSLRADSARLSFHIQSKSS